jgi:aquaporin Z
MTTPTQTVPEKDRTARSPAGQVDKRAIFAEFFGTVALVFFGVGSIIFARQFLGAFGIALAFGFILLVLCYTLGPISGSHVNPAVTLGMLLTRRISLFTAVCYWIAQFAGGLIGGALLAWVFHSVPPLRLVGHGSFGSPGYDSDSAVRITLGGAFLVEVILTALLVWVYLSMTRRHTLRGWLEAVPIGLAYAVVNFFGLALTGVSVNPARALGSAVYASNNAMSQVWLFIFAPFVGTVIAVLLYLATHGFPDAGSRVKPAGIQPDGSEGAARPYPGGPDTPHTSGSSNPVNPPGAAPHEPPQHRDIASSPHDMPPTAVAAVRQPVRRRRRRPPKATERRYGRPGVERRPA